MDGNSAALRIGNTGNEGDLIVRDSQNREVFHVDGGNAILRIGTTGNEGDISLRDAQNREVLHANGDSAELRIGTQGNGGDLTVRDSSNREVLRFSGNTAELFLGAAQNEGDLRIRDDAGREVFHMDGGSAVLRIGTTGNEGDLRIHDAADREVFQFNAEFAVLRVGAQGNEGDIIVRDDNGNESIHLNGGTGDIILRNADVAEQFEAVDRSLSVPGTLMVLTADGRVTPSHRPYDRKVAGVVAGAGTYHPGILMDHRADSEGKRVPIAMIGKAFCRADASSAPIEVGDLLTTSSTFGCAMRADDPQRSFGAIVGKALSGLDTGTGFVEVLISLQ